MNQKGQAYLEVLIGLPLMTAISMLTLGYALLPLTQQYLRTQLHEYQVCRLMDKSQFCKRDLDQKLRALFLHPYRMRENSFNLYLEVPKWKLSVTIKKEGY